MGCTTVRIGGAGTAVTVRGGSAQRVVLDKRTVAAIDNGRPQVMVNAAGTPVQVDQRDTVVRAGSAMGVQGPKGESAASYTHTQVNASTVWTINHNLGFRPAIALLTDGGAVIDAEIAHASANTAVVTLSQPLAGKARCN